ncbi:MAG: GWxTD domain-containing protein [Clostridiales bacterium]|nr:GWxTD domain-containing protein [Clostridiales bacterium]
MKTRWPLFLFFIIFFSSCAIFPKGAHLTDEEKEFLSAVRYIITGEEKNVFLALPSSERPRFIEEFWKRRDLSPETELNEYKDEYYRRVEAAKHLFTEGGTSGWLQDRGRVYILLGPPEQREQYPRGYTFYGLPMEIWHYGFHQLIFIDSRWNGNFELQPESARMIAEINAAQMQLKPQIRKEKTEEKIPFDFSAEIKRISAREMAVAISVPYKNVWFSSEKETFKTTLEVAVDIFNAGGEKVLSESRSYPLSLTEKKLKDLGGQDFTMEFPFALEPGEYRAVVKLKNLTGGTEIRKELKIAI